ncbi:MAG: hypothetical protein AB7O37_18130 [Vicinamibacteria bacterium]
MSADLTDRYAAGCRPIDVCGLTPGDCGQFEVTFWQWHWDPAPRPLDVTPIVEELAAATCSMLDGPQAALAGAGLVISPSVPGTGVGEIEVAMTSSTPRSGHSSPPRQQARCRASACESSGKPSSATNTASCARGRWSPPS